MAEINVDLTIFSVVTVWSSWKKMATNDLVEEAKKEIVPLIFFDGDNPTFLPLCLYPEYCAIVESAFISLMATSP